MSFIAEKKLFQFTRARRILSYQLLEVPCFKLNSLPSGEVQNKDGKCRQKEIKSKIY